MLSRRGCEAAVRWPLGGVLGPSPYASVVRCFGFASLFLSVAAQNYSSYKETEQTTGGGGAGGCPLSQIPVLLRLGLFGVSGTPSVPLPRRLFSLPPAERQRVRMGMAGRWRGGPEVCVGVLRSRKAPKTETAFTQRVLEL